MANPIKKEAAALLRSRFILACVISALSVMVTSLLYLIYELLSFISGAQPRNVALICTVAVAAPLSLFLIAPLNLGASRWYLRCAQGQNPQLIELFCYFSSAKSIASSIAFTVKKALVALIPALICAAPAAAFAYMSLMEDVTQVYKLAFEILSVIFALLTLFFAVVGVLLSSFCDQFYIDGRSGGIKVMRAVRFAYNNFGALMRLVGSFCGWFALCILALPVICVSPYYQLAKSALYEKLKNEKEDRTE